MTREEFTQILSAIRAAYPNEKITKEKTTLELWWKYLEPADYGLVSGALDAHIQKNKFPPTISELLNKANRKNRFNNFLPRNYDMDKLERALLLSGNEGKRLEGETMKNYMNEPETCGTCLYHKRNADGEWVCCCEDSDAYGCETLYEDGCGEHVMRCM